MRAVIPAGGFGTRMLPATKSMPKEMLPVVDKPTIQYVIEEARDAGIEDICIITGRTKRGIEDHFDKAPELEHFLQQKGKTAVLEGLQRTRDMGNLIYVRQDWPQGLGHAVLQAAPVVEQGPFAVLLGDDIIVGDKPVTRQLIEAHEATGKTVIAVQRVPKADVSKYGVVAIEPGQDGLHLVTEIVEKPAVEDAPSDLAVIGRYVFTPDIIAKLRETGVGVGGEIQLTDAIAKQVEEGNVMCLEFTGRRFDVGAVTGWLEANVALALEGPHGEAVRAILEAELARG